MSLRSRMSLWNRAWGMPLIAFAMGFLAAAHPVPAAAADMAASEKPVAEAPVSDKPAPDKAKADKPAPEKASEKPEAAKPKDAKAKAAKPKDSTSKEATSEAAKAKDAKPKDAKSKDAKSKDTKAKESKAKDVKAEAAAKKSSKAASDKPKPDKPKPLEKGATFDIDRATVWLGRTQVLPFHVTEAADDERRFAVQVKPAGHVTVLTPPCVLAKEEIGFLRVRGQKEGKATLRIGDAEIDIDVKPASAALVGLPGGGARAGEPIITSPAAGSVVWGEFAVGVELLLDATDLDKLADVGEQPEIILHVNGKEHESASLLDKGSADHVPWRHLAFNVDTAGIEPGAVELTAVIKGADGKPKQHSRSVTVHVVEPEDDKLVVEEAEALAEAPRPDRYGKEPQSPLRLGESDDASGGKYVNNHTARPPMTITVNAESAGWYQLMLRVASDFGVGAYPTVGVRLGSNTRFATAGRVVTADWHRIAIGKPIRLKAGEHPLVVYYENDFAARGQNRNLRIDTYELLRLDRLPAPPEALTDRADDPRLSVAMDPGLHGRTIAGDITVTGRVRWQRTLSTDPPLVTLLVDGKPVMTQRSASPTFQVSRGWFEGSESGDHTIELEALLSRNADQKGLRARSGAQTVTLAKFEGDAPQPRRMLHFAATDEAWGTSMRKRLRDEDSGRVRVAAFLSNARETLTLPDGLSGEFDILIDARGTDFDGQPKAEVTLTTGDETTTVGEIEVANRLRLHRVGTVTLADDAKAPGSLGVAFTNDKYDAESKKDRNLYLAAVVLHEVAEKDAAAPAVQILYPESGHEIFGTDAVVIDTADNRSIRWAELIIDGQATGFRVTPTLGDARLLLPLITRELSPGEHEIAVRVSDVAGKNSTSQTVPVTIREKAPDEPTQYQRAVRLLDRFAYGPEPGELAAVLTMGEEAYLRDRLWRTWDDPGEVAAWNAAAAVYPNDNSTGDVPRRALRYVMTTPNPVRARFVMFSANHFSTWMRKTRAARKADEFATFARIGPAPFADLLMGSATSPAMLVYLDQQRSFVRRINENYAREVMELHSLGVGGGYTQEDVTSLAHLLTGWTYSEDAPVDADGGWLASTFRYVPQLNAPDARRVFGLRLPKAETPAQHYDRARMALEMLAGHPATARHISRKLVEHYVAIPAPEPLVDDLATVFMQTGGDLREVLLAMGTHDAFIQDFSPRLTQPFDFAIRLSRVTRYDNPNPVIGYLDRSVVGLFDRDTPDGYPEEDEAYTDSNVTLQRWRLTREIEWALFRLVPTPLRSEKPRAGVDEQVWRQRLVDAIAVGITGHPLGERSNKAAMDVLEATDQKGNYRLLLIAGVIAQMPEALLR